MQVNPIEPTLKLPGTKRLTLKYEERLSNFASKFNLRRYIKPFVQPLLQWIKKHKEENRALPLPPPVLSPPPVPSPAATATADADADAASASDFAPAAIYEPSTGPGAAPAQRFPTFANFAFDRSRVLSHF